MITQKPPLKLGTIKTYANKTRKEIEVRKYSFDDDSSASGLASTFDHMHFVLSGKNVKEGTIYLIDNDIKTMLNFIKLIKTEDTAPLKIGVLFRINGHTSPFCIEKKYLRMQLKTSISIIQIQW